MAEYIGVSEGKKENGKKQLTYLDNIPYNTRMIVNIFEKKNNALNSQDYP